MTAYILLLDLPFRCPEFNDVACYWFQLAHQCAQMPRRGVTVTKRTNNTDNAERQELHWGIKKAIVHARYVNDSLRRRHTGVFIVIVIRRGTHNASPKRPSSSNTSLCIVPCVFRRYA